MPPLAAVSGAGLDPLTMTTAATSWRIDPITLVVIAAVLAGYLWLRRGSALPARTAVAFGGLGCGVWLLASVSFVGVYSDTLFWVRALQFVLLLMVAPFGLALGRPVSLLREHPRLGPPLDRALHSTAGRVLTSPPVTSLVLLATPWLIYLTGWYPALLADTGLDVLTRFWLIAVGFGYFYTRLQIDPVPRTFSPALSLIISAGEAIGDGVLGVVLWQGPLVAAAHYTALARTWGPSIRTDQTIGAGVLWILGDVVGVPFLLALLSRFTADDRARAEDIDTRLDSAAAQSATDTSAGVDSSDEVAPALWWEADPQMRERFDR